jgi:hypothetical protein
LGVGCGVWGVGCGVLGVGCRMWDVRLGLFKEGNSRLQVLKSWVPVSGEDLGLRFI